jgi:tetratricopeptide (TPR) repeat protein
MISNSRKLIVVSLGLLALAFGAFYPCLRNGFITFDDSLYITGNPHVQGGFTWDNFRWAFTTLDGGIWHPFTWLSIMLDCQLYGLDPAGHHFTNVMLHAANTVFLFLAWRKLTGLVWSSAFVAALFAVHPLHVESVAWAAERKDVLSGFFWMLALLAYAYYVETAPSPSGGPQSPAGFWTRFRSRRAKLCYLLCLLAFVCGLMSKSMVVTLPLILLLLDVWPLRRAQTSSALGLALEKLPFFFIALLLSLLTMHSQRQLGALISAADLPLGRRVANALLSYFTYLGQTLWPRNLAVFYPFPKTIPIGLPILAALLLLGFSVLAVRWRGRRPYLFTGWFWYLLTLLPVIGLIQVGSQSHADRYVYLPLIGIFALATWTLLELLKSIALPNTVISSAAIAVLTACLFVTHRQISYWTDSETLFRWALAVTEDNRIAHDNLGTALMRRGQVDEAIGHFKATLRLKPDDPEELNNLALVLLRKGETGEAISLLEQALRLRPRDDSTHYSLGLAYGQTGRLEDAQKQFAEALRLQPGRADARCGLGIVLLRLRQPDQAIAELNEALRLNPRYPEAHYQLGVALMGKGQVAPAIENFYHAILLKPDYVDAHRSLAIALGSQGKLDDAIQEFQNILGITPDNAQAHCDLGIALMRNGRVNEGVREFQKAVALAPASAESHANLGAALARTGRIEEGIPHLQEALRLRPEYPAAYENLNSALNARLHQPK